jgi:putative redox protein
MGGHTLREVGRPLDRGVYHRVMRPAIVTAAEGKFRQSVHVGAHALVADEPADKGGDDTGPEPHEFLLVGLGACTSMTLGAYARHKGLPLKSVEVTVEGAHVDGAFVMRRHIRVEGDLTDEQRARLLEIANKCPVHKTLTGKIAIETDLAAR